MTQDRPLALSFPLHGSQLIEASAGTGKTFTISALYLRLILGHGGEQGFDRELLPPQILVVTFTDAATKELRERIRARLAEAARFSRGELVAATLCRAPENRRAVDGRICGIDHPRLVPAHAARTCLRQRQPVHPDLGNRP